MTDQRYELVVAPTARRQLAETLPESVAFAAYEFITGPLLDNPHRVGKRLRPPLEDRHSARRGTYRVIYRIDDEQRR
ncbi:type II toxin-antitoxin system RelE family toxin [Mycobacterium asiaticum]|uniref:Plasmid stabilization protein n=1 Tax=Mycobacterium asiaticum TaxID=1790 RepID=A0A1A3NAD2_MYCAS|nr:plasmid stabilization protein [Mycobacterium asiaticum]OBK18009.1 plasmid stabilization protein [Mycobacterium asiaticum]OBK95137.1 plasmid stabilization protein [Mycobacterium asiaticum]